MGRGRFVIIVGFEEVMRRVVSAGISNVRLAIMADSGIGQVRQRIA